MSIIRSYKVEPRNFRGQLLGDALCLEAHDKLDEALGKAALQIPKPWSTATMPRAIPFNTYVFTEDSQAAGVVSATEILERESRELPSGEVAYRRNVGLFTDPEHRLPDGLTTLLEEHGYRVSGGILTDPVPLLRQQRLPTGVREAVDRAASRTRAAKK